jgi:hypothetical protein
MGLTPGKQSWIVGCVTLGLLLVVGISVFDDYGVSWDERVQRGYGEKVYSYVTEGDRSLFLDRHRYYGPVFEFVLVAIEKGLDLTDTRDIYLMRHLVTFLVFWLGAVFFFLLCRKVFNSLEAASAGVLLLVLSPRIFAHAFYNSKDIPFMAVFIIGVFTLLRYLDKKSLRSAALHGAVCALLTDIRIVGTLLALLTVLFAGFEVFKNRRAPAEVRRILTSFGICAAVLAGLTVLLWPTLWRDPIHNFVRVFEGMRNFPWEATVLYRGAYVWSTDLPWHYIPVWIGITTPAAAGILFFGGLAISGWSLLRKGGAAIAAGRDVLIIICWSLLPLAYSILSKAVLYDAWRHSFFIYPAVVMMALLGWVWVARRKGMGWNLGTWVVRGLVGLSLAYAASFMIQYHPHQNVYFNWFAGGIKGADGRFELDYWGLSYRQGLEYIVGHDSGDRVLVHAATPPGRYNADILEPEDRKRLVFVTERHKAQYHMTHFRWEKDRPPLGTELYSVRIDGVPIMTVYRVR